MHQSLSSIRSADIAAITQQDLPWEELSGVHAVVTGATGFLGGYIVRSLIALHSHAKVSKPIRLTILVRNREKAIRELGDVLSTSGRVEIKQWDLNQIATPPVEEFQVAIHAASNASPRFFNNDPVGTILPNTIGTAALLSSFSKSHERRGFVFISSSEVYGATQAASVLTESARGIVDQTNLRACYAESKRAGETMCVAWHHQEKVPTFIVRPFHTYGPGLSQDDGRVFADFAFNVAYGRNITMTGDGKARRAFCYVSDAVAGIFTALLKGTAGTAYNVANSAAVLSISDLARLLLELYPEKSLDIERTSTNEKYIASPYNDLIPDTSRLESLGWRPWTTPEEGFRRMIDSIET
jgi:dTDP-glucose 4,6-dehydratase